ncbi:CaiB/BaiF CoA transferase family protein [Desertibacillus haloalkaliphilus]|uniref:CaiB/BaiF CoA transferase family protein n=1 Tax=Desertibacillus haloalkaliphilus TaxID=1328930 RepID=UPI001C262024|nr:CaiB/BaiF CoA-transferase family protein [Desertibacillus haloalkaliphilus]MBU8908903.1 CoA transferase [Desertibacillus haloalkaliphilus]
MLDGLRVLDFSQYLPGPYASLRLADQGAEVIKVEPLTGDPARSLGAKKRGNGLVFLANNRNKKSVTINVKEPKGQEIALQLMEESDVVLESFRPGVMERLGLGYEKAKHANPNIIYCSITGYGQESSLSHFGSHDLNYVAMSGILSQLKDDQGKPVHPTITFADLVGGIAASESILAALVQRGIKGTGAYIDLSLTDAMVSMMNTHIHFAEEINKQNGVPQLSGDMISYHLYETKDGRYMSLGALEPKFWVNFCHAVGKEHWIPAHMSQAREDNHVYNEVKQLFLSHSQEEWISFLHKVDCCLAPVLECGELVGSSYIQERNLIGASSAGNIEVATTYDESFARMNEVEAPPALSQHTEEVLEQLLKMEKADIATLKDKKII